MKLLSIHLKNLNSLKGEFFLSFEKPPLKNCGLFLITGSTGAGKSTILDAITLALFGEVPRFQDMSGKNKERKIVTHGTSDAFSEVTFESGGQIYRAKWSIGQVTRGKNKGRFQDSRRELVQLADNRESGQPITTKKQEVNAAVEQLLNGLNFKRFTRSVMLAQGDFAEFLKNVKDRAEILERITNSQRYSEISMAAYERHKLAERELQQLQEQRAHFSLLSPEEKEHLLAERAQLEEATNKSAQQLQQFQQQLQQLQRLQQLQQEAQTLAQAQTQLTQDWQAAQPQLEALERHQQAVEYQPALIYLEELEEKRQQQQVQLEQWQQQFHYNQQQLQSLQTEAQQGLLHLQKAEKAYLVFDQNYAKVVALDSTIHNLQQSLEEGKQTIADLEEKITRQKGVMVQLEQAQINTQNQQQQAQSWLKDHAHYAPLANTPLVEQLQSKQDKRATEQSLLNKALLQQQKNQQQQEQLQTQKAALEKRLSSTQTQLEETRLAYQQICEREGLDSQQAHEEHLQTVRRSYEDLDGLLELLRQIEEERKAHYSLIEELYEQEEEMTGQQGALEQLDNAFLTNEVLLERAYREKLYYEGVYRTQQERNNLSALRGTLKEGEPCPLCFSEEHPFRAMQVDVNFALQQAATDLQRAEEKHERFYKQERDILDRQRLAVRLLNEAQQKKDRLQHKVEQVETRISRLLEQYPTPSGLVIHQKQALERHIHQTNASIKQYQQLEQQLKEVARQAQNLEGEQKRWQEQLQLLAQNQKQEQARAAELTLDIQHHQTQQQELEKMLNKALKPFQLTLEDDQALEKLATYRQEFRAQQEGYDLQKHQLEKLQNDLKNAQERALDWQQEQVQQQQSWGQKKEQLEGLRAERSVLFEGDSVEDAKQEHLQQLEQLRQAQTTLQQQINQQQQAQADLEGRQKANQVQLKALQQELQQKTTALLARLSTAGLDDLSTLRALLLEEEEVKAYQQSKETLLQRQQRLAQQQTDNEQYLIQQQEHLALALPTPPSLEELPTLIEKLQEALKSLEQARGEQLQQLGGIKEKLEQQAKQQQEQAALLERIAQHQQEVQRWNGLSNLIGSASGNKFRRFAQSITLKKLVRLANVHLSIFLNQRYYLEMRLENPENTKDTELLEIDIVDTFQLNNKRPLNTLSGGESFLASLSLALALSDLASGQTSIESLFIDEGFGTLDSNTLQMAIRALQLLQQQGKTVGIISHVEKLKQSIDTQIQVTKKGGGYSSVSIL